MGGEEGVSPTTLYLSSPTATWEARTHAGVAGVFALSALDPADTAAAASSLPPSLAPPQVGVRSTDIAFVTKRYIGKAVLDSGASITVATKHFVTAAGLSIRPHGREAAARVALPNGMQYVSLGKVDIPMLVQLQVVVDDVGQCIWERQFELRNVCVFDFGDKSPRDVYISWPDFCYDAKGAAPSTPLGELAQAIANGARMINSPRPINTAKTDVGPLLVTMQPSPSSGADIVAAITAAGPQAPAPTKAPQAPPAVPQAPLPTLAEQ